MKKRILSLFMVLMMLCAFVPCIHAAEIVDSGTCGKNGDNVTWTLDSEGVLTISGTGEMADWNGSMRPWKQIDDIKQIIIDNGVSNIGGRAFESFDVSSIKIGNDVTCIGKYAFHQCCVPRIDLPDSVTRIEERAFYEGNIQKIKLSNNLNYIGFLAFWGTGERIDDLNVFEVYIDDLSSYLNIQFDGTFNHPSLGTNKLYINERLAEDIEIPDNVSVINSTAFYNFNNIKSVTLPDTVTNIGAGAFAYCRNLTKIVFSSNVSKIGDSSFYACRSLKDISYKKSKEDWNKISIGMQNDSLTNADIHFNATGTNSPQIGDLTLGSSLSGVDLIKVPLTDTEYDSTMIAAFYKDGAMVDMQTTPVSSGDEMKDVPIPKNINADTAKVFIWSSLDKMKPLCESKEIKLTEEDM